MKIGILAGKQTKELISYLEANFSKDIVLSVLFPEENLAEADLDLVILEKSQGFILSTLLSLPTPPTVAIIGQGINHENVFYLPDFFGDFPKLWKELVPHEPMITFVHENQKFVYRQTDIIAVTNDVPVLVHLRTGYKIAPKTGYRQLYSKLDSNLFFKVSETAMANILYVAQIESDAVCMKNGLRLPFSPEEKQAMENAFYKIKFHENRPQQKKR